MNSRHYAYSLTQTQQKQTQERKGNTTGEHWIAEIKKGYKETNNKHNLFFLVSQKEKQYWKKKAEKAKKKEQKGTKKNEEKKAK